MFTYFYSQEEVTIGGVIHFVDYFNVNVVVDYIKRVTNVPLNGISKLRNKVI